MHLTHLSIENLYGSLNKEVFFKSDLNLLVGINGSGKTSILKMVDWLLRPNLARLCITHFEKAKLSFVSNNENYTIVAEHKENKLFLYLLTEKTKQLPPITIKLITNPAISVGDINIEEVLERYSNLSLEPSELPMWEELNKIPKPLVVELDRSITAEDGIFIYLDPATPGARRKRARNRSPLEKVKEVTRERYSAYRSKIIEFNDELKAKILLSALNDPMSMGDFSRPGERPKGISPSEIGGLEKKVTTYLASAIKDGSEQLHVKQYFKSMKILASANYGKNKNTFVFGGLFSQFRQLEELTKAFKEFEKKSADAFNALSMYVDIVNQFFVDSRKRIRFNESNNDLYFQFLDKNDAEIGDLRAIDYLSSGEKQILILLTFLAFVSNRESVFIVDEPELSLHPKWQMEFIQAVQQIKSPSSQVLVATHSPEMVSKNKKSCIVLLPD